MNLTTNGLLSITRAAETLRVTRATIYSAIRRGDLVRVYIDEKPFVTVASVSKFKKRPYTNPAKAATV